jgi:hypothetical protein
MVMDVVMAYTRYEQEKADNKRQGLPPPGPEIPLNTLQEMIERVKNK